MTVSIAVSCCSVFLFAGLLVSACGVGNARDIGMKWNHSSGLCVERCCSLRAINFTVIPRTVFLVKSENV